MQGGKEENEKGQGRNTALCSVTDNGNKDKCSVFAKMEEIGRSRWDNLES